MQKPMVSIGMPVFNGEKFLEKSLQSLLAQTYTDFELIISDNASTDKTEEICNDFESKDRRIKYYRNLTNIGLSANFNKVFRISRGEFFKWNNSDDLSGPNYLNLCVETMACRTDVVLINSWSKFIDAEGKNINGIDYGWQLMSDSPSERMLKVIDNIDHWVNSLYGLIRTNALVKTRLLGPYPGADYRLLAELSMIGKFFVIPNVLFWRRLHSGATSNKVKNEQWIKSYYYAGRKIYYPRNWCILIDFLLIVLLCNLKISKKINLAIRIIRWARWNIYAIRKELATVVKHYL